MKLFSSAYGVARHIYIPLIKVGVVDFAKGADWTPAGGDVKISKDGGAAQNVTHLPVSLAMGNTAVWDFQIEATEMQAAQIIITVADSASKAVEDDCFVIETFGVAQGVMDLNAIADCIYKRDYSLISGEASFSLLNAARSVRNKWAIQAGTRTVYKEDGSTEAYTQAVVGTSGATPVTSVG
jgi:hypothetical protein